MEVVVVDINPAQEMAVAQVQSEAQQRGIDLTLSFCHVRREAFVADITRAMADDHFDVVYISTPNRTHCAYIDFFLPRARHVLVEKPLTDSLSDLLQLEQGLGLGALSRLRLVDHYLFKPPVRQVLQEHARYLDEIGPLTRVAFYLLEPRPIRPSRMWLYRSGMVRDLAVHFLSILFKLFDLGVEAFSPEKLRLRSATRLHYTPLPDGITDPMETAAHLVMEFDGVSTECTVGKGTGITRKQLVLEGTDGRLVIDTPSGTLTLTVGTSESTETPPRPPSEHHVVFEDLFSGVESVGLPYGLAKAEVGVFEEADRFPVSGTYPVGEYPF